MSTVTDCGGEEIDAGEAMICAVCERVFHQSGPITFEPSWTMCGHEVCDECQAKGPRLERSEGRWCAGCQLGI